MPGAHRKLLRETCRDVTYQERPPGLLSLPQEFLAIVHVGAAGPVLGPVLRSPTAIQGRWLGCSGLPGAGLWSFPHSYRAHA